MNRSLCTIIIIKTFAYIYTGIYILIINKLYCVQLYLYIARNIYCTIIEFIKANNVYLHFYNLLFRKKTIYLSIFAKEFTNYTYLTFIFYFYLVKYI